jgi:hypothetical protein
VGCGQGSRPDINGKTGITVDAHGRLIIVAEICHGTVRHVGIYGPNRNASPNRVDAELSTTPQSRSFTLDPATPDSKWTGQPLRPPLTDELHIADAHNGKSSGLAQVSFVPADLASLQPGIVQYGDHDPAEGSASPAPHVRVDDFHDIACKAP